MSKVLYMTPGPNPHRTYEAVKQCVAAMVEAGLPGEIKVTTPDIQALETELRNLREFVHKKGLTFEFGAAYGSGKITAIWVDEESQQEGDTDG